MYIIWDKCNLIKAQCGKVPNLGGHAPLNQWSFSKKADCQTTHN